MTEPNTQPPEVKGREPLRYDPIPIETVYEWRDRINGALETVRLNRAGGAHAIAMLGTLALDIEDAIDNAHGFNDPQPSEDD